ncbi:radical SAM protein [Dyella sp.]|uniref:radical SAM protein n=1 Tax=Dyella sp. TaxID=1869338 RepID=UPI002ED05BE5
MAHRETLYHVAVLSNFARGFDKYALSYSKAGIPESTYPDRFFLLRHEELAIGIAKATPLLHKLALDGNRLIVLRTEVDSEVLHENTRNGKGRFVQSDRIALAGLHELAEDGHTLRPIEAEDAMADSLRMLQSAFHDFADIVPRSVSFLPIAMACQARCAFCFSKASISSDQSQVRVDWDKVAYWLDRARAEGAERAVITGGGEPTLLPRHSLERLVAESGARFSKVVLITNGHVLAVAPEAGRIERLQALHDAGLRVLAISRHHFDDARNLELMQLATPVAQLLASWHEHRVRWPLLRLRLICVLQQGGVQDRDTLVSYLDWAVAQGVPEICFKELYVSTSAESLYHDRQANAWSRAHQVSLSLVTDFAHEQGFTLHERLPWGAPVYGGNWKGRSLRIAAYTEPSLFWERSHGVARSWNVLADGRCYVSLEDRASQLHEEI